MAGSSHRSVSRRSAFSSRGLSRNPRSASRFSENEQLPISLLKAVQVRLPRVWRQVCQTCAQSGPSSAFQGLGQAFALRHDVVDRAGGERHGFLAAVIFEPLEHRIAMPEAVHVAARQLGAEGVVGGEGVPVGLGQEVGPDALDIAVRFDGARSLGEHRRRGRGLVAADGAAHGIGGDQPGQGDKVMPETDARPHSRRRGGGERARPVSWPRPASSRNAWATSGSGSLPSTIAR